MPVYYFGHGDAKERFKFWLENTPSTIAIDVETISLKERHPLGFAIAVSPQEAFYFDLTPEPPRELEMIIPWLEDIRILKVAHNWMFDMGVFPLIPIVGGHLNRANIWDTNIAARLLGHVETSLPILASEVVGMNTTAAGVILKDNGCKDMMQLWEKDLMLIADHCQRDVKATFALYLEWKNTIFNKYQEYFSVEMQVIPILLEISMRGIAIDQRARRELSESYAKEIEFYDSYIKSFGISKPSSSQQVGYVLAERGNFLRMTRSKRQLSTRESELAFLSDPLAAAVLNYREKTKFKSTYLDPLEGQDRFYTEFYMDTSVGRLNSRNRNIQNIPVKARVMFVPDSGYFCSGDYSQEHLRILAHRSEDRLMKAVYEEGRYGGDFHKLTAEKLGLTRPLARTINYAIVYGATPKTVSEQARIRDLDRCARYIDDWFKTYREAADYIQYLQEVGLRDGWAAPTLFGRRIKIPDESEDGMKRKAVNYPILGCIPGSSRILTKSNGYIPIEDASPTEEVWDGERFVNASVAYSGKKAEVIVKLGNGQKLVCSPDHNLLVENSRRNRTWKTPAQIKPQDSLCLSSPTTIHEEVPIPYEVLTTHWKAPKGIGNARQQTFSSIKNYYQLGFVLGRLASDGWFSVERRTLRWIVADNEIQVLHYIRNALKVFRFSERRVTEPYRNVPLHFIDIYSVQLAKQAHNLGIGNRIPPVAWKNSNLLKGYLAGLFDGDGTVSDSPILSIGGEHVDTSYPEEVQQALLLLGIRSTVRRYYNIPTSEGRRQDIAKVRVRAKDNSRFASLIGFVNSTKQHKLTQTDSMFSPYFSRHIEPVRSVTFTNNYVDMYDVVNSDSHQFMTEGYITHNSDGEVIKRAVILANNRGLGPPTMAITVHDSITWDGDVEDKLPVDEISHIPGFNIPFEVKTTLRWEK